jgi:hypothetical protein
MGRRNWLVSRHCLVFSEVRGCHGVFRGTPCSEELPFSSFVCVESQLTTHVLGCGSRFVDMVKGYEIMGGYDNLILGQGVPGYGKDGISELDSRLKKNMKTEESVMQQSEKADSAVDVEVSAADA